MEEIIIQCQRFCIPFVSFRTNSVTGRIMVNGRNRDMSEFRKLSAYIMQDDNLQPLLTVQEAMHVAADLKLRLSHCEKSRKVDQSLLYTCVNHCVRR